MFKKKRPSLPGNVAIALLERDHEDASLSLRIKCLNEDLAKARAKLAESEARYKVELEESDGYTIATAYQEYAGVPVKFAPQLGGARAAKWVRVTDRKTFTYRVVELSVPIWVRPTEPITLQVPPADDETVCGKLPNDFYTAVTGGLYLNYFADASA